MTDLPPLAAGTQPGWYDDPADGTKRRYWDGSAWTDRTALDAAKLPRTGPTPSSEITPGGVPQPAQPEASNNTKIGCGALIGIVVVATVLFSMLGGSEEDDNKVGAIVVCEQFVEQRLRSPGSADFQTANSDRVRVSGDTFVYSAFVDSQNGFGAELRTDFICTVEHIEGDRFRLVDLQLLE